MLASSLRVCIPLVASSDDDKLRGPQTAYQSLAIGGNIDLMNEVITWELLTGSRSRSSGKPGVEPGGTALVQLGGADPPH
jgi:hypothetical protein